MIDPHIAPDILVGAIIAGALFGLGWAFADQLVKVIRALMEPVYGKIVRRIYGAEGMRMLCICGLLIAVVLAVVAALSISF